MGTRASFLAKFSYLIGQRDIAIGVSYWSNKIKVNYFVTIEALFCFIIIVGQKADFVGLFIKVKINK